MNGNVGTLNTDAISATILDLIDKNYYKIVTNDINQTIIRQTGKDTSDLKEHELLIIDFFSRYAVNGDISMGVVGRSSNHNDFKMFKYYWMELAKNEVLI